jgi:hypothetical protein
MARLEDLTPGTAVRGILPDSIVTVVAADWFGANAIRLTYTDAAGKPGQQLLYRDNEPTIEIAQVGRPWSFDGDGALLRLVSKAYRIRLAYLFDPYLAVQTSLVEPLPHQITAVYGEMLKRQPLRFLLADDPGAGKTIMTGLFIKELMARGDLQRCLIVCPGDREGFFCFRRQSRPRHVPRDRICRLRPYHATRLSLGGAGAEGGKAVQEPGGVRENLRSEPAATIPHRPRGVAEEPGAPEAEHLMP